MLAPETGSKNSKNADHQASSSNLRLLSNQLAGCAESQKVDENSSPKASGKRKAEEDAPRRSSRDRKPRKHEKYDSLGVVPHAEEKMIAQAVENSKVLTKLEYGKDVPEAPIFFPTAKEFENPIAYIASIQVEAMKSGICKIVPPAGWKPPDAREKSFNGERASKTFATKRQYLHRLEEGIYYPEGKRYNIAQYEEMANAFEAAYVQKMSISRAASLSAASSDEKKTTPTPEGLIKEYWRVVETQRGKAEVEYGNDLDTLKYGSGFPVAPHLQEHYANQLSTKPSFNENVTFSPGDPSYYEHCGWNLNNLPHWPGSLLRNVRGNYNGLNVPWLYIGMLFSTFAWHNEDNYLYAINYSHHGATKVWYGVPGSDALKFEGCVEKMKLQRFKGEKDVLQKLVLMTGPATLTAAGVPLVRAMQNPGEFIVTFPQAYHGGFSLGFNCGEAVNFALPEWIPFGRDASERYRKTQRPASISNERLLMTVASDPEDLKDVSACDALIADLEITMKEQNTLRHNLDRAGIVNQVAMPADEDSESYDEKRQCHVCMHMCYISALVCSCDAKRVVCLRHFRDLCNCASSRKAFLYWHSIRDIEDMIERVQAYAMKLRHKESPGFSSALNFRDVYRIPTETQVEL